MLSSQTYSTIDRLTRATPWKAIDVRPCYPPFPLSCTGDAQSRSQHHPDGGLDAVTEPTCTGKSGGSDASDSRGGGSSTVATTTSATSEATGSRGGASPSRLIRPVQPLLCGGPPLSDCSSQSEESRSRLRLTGSRLRSGSTFAARDASLSSLDSSFSDEDGGYSSSRSSGVCSSQEQGRSVEARRRSFVSHVLLLYVCRDAVVARSGFYPQVPRFSKMTPTLGWA